MDKVKLEYIWLDGYTPEPNMRSKTKIISADDAEEVKLEDCPEWSFDGSSTEQAEGSSSDCILKPVAIYPDTARENAYLVMTEVYAADGSIHPSNSRGGWEDDPETWIAFEQEYFFTVGDKPIGFPKEGYPGPQGPYYCSVGSEVAKGREVVEEHLDLCLDAGIGITGINAEVACSAYAKLTGRPAACFTIAGPGATNLTTGLYDAKVDRAPLLALTGQVDTQVLGPGAFQEVDLIGTFKDVSAFNHTVYADSKHGELISLALKNALLTRNPVTVVLPNEVQEMPNPDGAVGSPDGRVAALDVAPPQSALDQAVAKIKEAKRPVLIVGHGARFHMDAVIRFAEKLGIPVLTTFKGKGLIADSHPLGCGVLGRSGTPVASWFMNECDRIIAVGTSFSNHTGIASYMPTIQIDFDPMALGKFHAVDLPLLGEIGRTFDLLHDAFPDSVKRPDIHAEVAERWRIWHEEKESRMADDTGHGINAASVFAAMTRQCQDDAVIAVDVGNNTYSFGRYFETSGRQAVLMSGYLGSIGFGYPAAMGAWAATQEDDPGFSGRPVWAVSGDGGFGQYMVEVLTAVKYKMNITHVLLHNDELGKISKEQRAAHFGVWKTDLHNPNFADYVTLCGGKGIRVTDPAKLDDALAEARDFAGPATVEIMTDALLV